MTPAQEVARALRLALEDGSLVGAVLSKPARADLPPRVDLRPVEVQGRTCAQWTERVGRQELHRNLPPAEAEAAVAAALADYRAATVRTTAGDLEALGNRRGQLRLRRREAARGAPDRSHDRARRRLLPDGEPVPFLVAIGVMGPDGRVKAPMQHKFRQINRFVELVDDVVPALPAGPLRVVDFGCGKSSLTFALHHLLTGIHGRAVDIVGLDRNPQVVATCAAVTERLGLPGLRFEAGDIASFQPDGPVDLAVSLHACDTATDDALAQAVRWGSRVILAVPCCQHELMPLLHPKSLPALTGPGLLRERFAALTTDGLRALALQAVGYQTQVVEFVDLEHTPKNLLLRATRGAPDAAAAEAYRLQKQTLGLPRTHLDAVLPGLWDG